MIFANDTHPPGDELTHSKEDEDSGVMMALGEDEPPLMGLGSDITESAAQNLSMALLAFNGGRVRAVPEDLDDTSDIEFYISSGGGSVSDMLALKEIDYKTVTACLSWTIVTARPRCSNPWRSVLISSSIRLPSTWTAKVAVSVVHSSLETKRCTTSFSMYCERPDPR